MTTTVIVHSDTHINSTVGLIYPAAEKDDGDSHKQSKGQRWLWKNWLKTLEYVDKHKQGDKLITYFNGDITETDAKKRTTQVISGNLADVVRWTNIILEPWVDMSDKTYMTRGTESHSGKSHQSERLVADNFDMELENAYLHTIDGVRLDIAHHPTFTGSSRPMLIHNAILRQAADSVFKHTRDGRQLPHLVIRSHVHRRLDSYDCFPVRAVTTAGWCLFTHYINRLAPNEIPHVGSLMIVCDRGEYEIHQIKHKPEAKKWQKV